jgi:hypothetical protein
MTDDVVSRINLPPDAGLVESLGVNHNLESAIADLIDNSVDATASRVVVRLLTSEDRLVQVEVADNGRGMDSATADSAMTIGERRDYSALDLGHFGMGLKAASFGHADVLTVWSAADNQGAVGRRIRRADFSRDFACEVLSTELAETHGSRRAVTFGERHGTTVIWSEIRNTYKGRNPAEARTWLSNALDALRGHLGLVFHRLIVDGRLTIEVEVDDRDQVELGIGVAISPIDPFGYAASGHPGYPKTLVAPVGESGEVRLVCHIWPGKSDRSGYRIAGKSGDQYQGFFVYRNDRLLQVGGWSAMLNRSPQRQLARVVIDDLSAIGPLVAMNPEKHGLRFEPAFHDAVAQAVAEDGTTFDDYLVDAEGVFASANRRSRSRKPAIAPDKGFAPQLRRIISAELPLISGDALRLQWRKMRDDEFLDVDFNDRTLWLNSRYRHLFAPERGSLNDAPVLKALLYLLTHHVFEGRHLGIRDKDDIELWKSVLGAAAETESKLREGRANA